VKEVKELRFSLKNLFLFAFLTWKYIIDLGHYQLEDSNIGGYTRGTSILKQKTSSTIRRNLSQMMIVITTNSERGWKSTPLLIQLGRLERSRKFAAA
jgi:hypothetical protein